MTGELGYRVEDFTVSLPVTDYIAGFRDAERFLGFCRECGNYGRSWGCPPFDCDVEARLRSFRNILLVATRIEPTEKGLPMSLSRALIRPERIRLENRLRELEKRYGGLSCSYVGSCLYCPEGTCTRPEGGVCRHPELVRSSLEAFGFDIGRTVSELFGMELEWGRDGKMPDCLTLVCGFFHNSDREIVWPRV